MAASIPWLSGVDYKRLCAWMPYVSIVLVLTRDRGSGRVTIGKDGLPRLRYWPDAHDRANMMKVPPSFPTMLLCRCMLSDCTTASLLSTEARCTCGEAACKCCKKSYPPGGKLMPVGIFAMQVYALSRACYQSA